MIASLDSTPSQPSIMPALQLRSSLNSLILPCLLAAPWFLAHQQLHAAEDGAPRLPSGVAKRCLAVLREGMRGEEFWPSIHAAEGLTLAGHGKEVIDYWQPRLQTEPDSQRRCGIARELVRAGHYAALPTLFVILEDSDSHGHVHAAESLYKIGEVGDGRAMRAAMAQRESPALRYMAAAALAKAGSPAAMELLRETVKRETRQPSDDDLHLRLSAWILGRIGEDADIPLLRAALKVATVDALRVNLQHALAALGDAEGRRMLLENLRSEDPATRTYAATFAGDAQLREAMRPLIPLLDDSHLDARLRAAQSLLVLASLESKPGAEPVAGAFSNLPFEANERHPRNTEGSAIRLLDGSLLLAATEFISQGSDFSSAHIVARRSVDGGRTWLPPRELQPNTGKMNVMSVTLRRMNNGDLGMFYLEKNSHSDLDIVFRRSTDDGQRFGPPVLVTADAGYHVMNNDRVVRLSSGRWLAPAASTPDVGADNHFTSRCYISDDDGKTWRKGREAVDAPRRGAMEPGVIELRDGRVMMYLRTQLGLIGKAYSRDGGETWTAMESLGLVAPEAPATCGRIPATGDLLMIWNGGHDQPQPKMARTPLVAAISQDEGATWKTVATIEPDPKRTYAYTSLLFMQGNALLSYWDKPSTAPARFSTRFRSLPVRELYGPSGKGD